MNHKVLIGLGSSLGFRERNLRFAHHLLHANSSLSIIKSSRVYHSVPLGEEAESIFYNQCLILETDLSPNNLLAVLKSIEVRAGRVRSRRWADRILDLDILLYDTIIIENPDLSIPHKGLLFRSFVIQPAQEIAGEWIIPTIGRTIKELKVPVPRCW